MQVPEAPPADLLRALWWMIGALLSALGVLAGVVVFLFFRLAALQKEYIDVIKTVWGGLEKAAGNIKESTEANDRVAGVLERLEDWLPRRGRGRGQG